MTIEQTPIFVAHCKQLAERRWHLAAQLDKYALPATWYTDHDADELTQAERDMGPNLQEVEISLAIKHAKIMEMIAAGDLPYALILEDDALLCDDFRYLFNKIFANDHPFDFASVGASAFTQRIVAIPEKYLYVPPDPQKATRCTHAYMVSKWAAGLLAGSLLPTKMPIDHKLNDQLYAHKLACVWVEPSLVSQGSELGVWPSCVKR